MSPVPIVEIRAVLQAIGIEASILFVKAAGGVGAGQEPAWTRGIEAVMPCNVARFDLPSRGFACPRLSDVGHARNGFAVTQSVKGGHAVVVHMPLAAVLHLWNGVIADIPVFWLEAHCVPD